MQITRRKFFSVFGAGAAGVGVDMRLLEPEALTVGRHTMPAGAGENRAPIRVLHLSDLHVSDCVSLDFIQRSVQLGLSLDPDLVCLTGDFISWRWEEWERYSAILAALPRRAPAFACLGNHDGGTWAASSRNDGYPDADNVRRLLANAGIELLFNSSRDIAIHDRPLRIVGVGDLYNHELDADAAFSPGPPPAGATTLLLCHNPDGKTRVAQRPWNLMLSGHTHGGQCRLPFLGTPFAPVLDHRFVEGLHPWRDRWIHVTRGVGNLHGVRFNCPPEVSLLTVC
jgi:uncharacterized protein